MGNYASLGLIPGELILTATLVVLMILGVTAATKRGLLAGAGITGLILSAVGPIKHLAAGKSVLIFQV